LPARPHRSSDGLFPYWLLFTLCAAGAVQYRRLEHRSRQGGPLLIAVAIITLLMIGLRYEVGGDWVNYEYIFDFARYQDVQDVLGRSDPGYGLLNWAVKHAGLDIWVINLVCAVFFTWGLTKFIRTQPNPWLALLVAVPYLVIVVAMGYTRQAVAIGFILVGIARLQTRQSMLEFGFYILLAAAFHKTAIIVLPLVAFAATRNRYLMIGLAALTGAMLYYLFLNAAIDRLMENYVTQEYDSQGAAIRVAMNLPPAALFLLFQKRFGLSDFDRKLWRNFALAAFAALVLLMMLNSSTVVDRLALYLIPLQLVVFARLPTVFAHGGKESGPFTLLVIGYSALVQFVWLTSAANADYWLPYKVYPL
jgi:hypothetical protein